MIIPLLRINGKELQNCAFTYMQQQSIIRSVLQKIGQRIDIETNYEPEENKNLRKDSSY
jgi:hypothetical protein